MRSGGMIAHAVSSTARSSGFVVMFGSADTSRTSSVRTSPLMSSTTTSARAWASSRTSRTSSKRPSPQNSRRRRDRSRSRLATLTKTDRVTVDAAVRTARATIAWFFRERPTEMTVIGAATLAVGRVASAPSVATRIWASPERLASLSASSRASPRSPLSLVGLMSSSACRTRPMSAVSLTTIRALRSAAMTETLPPVGSSRSASMTAALAASSRFGATSVAAMLADVSMTSTTSRASPAGRSKNGRAASSARITTSRSWSRSRRLRRSFCQGALASTSAIRRVHSKVDGTKVSSRRSFSRYIATTTGMNSRPSSASGVVNGMVG